MSNKTTGGPAFPQANDQVVAGLPLNACTGMTLRDYFAAKAMQAWIARSEWDASADDGFFSEMSYEIADAMLEARNAN